MKMNLKKIDVMLTYMMIEDITIDRVEIMYRQNRSSRLEELFVIDKSAINKERVIPDRILTKYGKYPVGMFQIKYTGADQLFARIIIDEVVPVYTTQKQEKRKRVKKEYTEMKKIMDENVNNNTINHDNLYY